MNIKVYVYVHDECHIYYAVTTWKWQLCTSGAATSQRISLVKLTGKHD